MFCKFCGNKIVPNAFSKCTFCGARIDLSDGGQSFFKDAEIETWKNSGLSNGPNTGMPRTEIKEFPEEKKAISKSAQKEDKLNPIPSKLSLMWIAGTIAFVLLLFGVVANLPKDETQGTDTEKKQTGMRIFQKIKEDKKEKVSKGEVANEESVEIDASAETDGEVKVTLQIGEQAGEIRGLIKDGELYICASEFLKANGHKDGHYKQEDDGSCSYIFSKSESTITIYIGKKRVWKEKDVKEDLEFVSFVHGAEDGKNVFVHAKSFIEKIFPDFTIDVNGKQISKNS